VGTSANFRMVRLGREIREMNQTALATHSGVTQASLSRVESGLRAATENELELLADALALPIGFFREPDTPAAAPLFRKRAIRSVRTNRRIQARVNIAVLAARRIMDAGIDVDTSFSFPDPGEVPRDDPAAAAEMLRRAWRLPNGRVDNMTDVIESAGGIVLHVDFGSDEASAAFLSSLGDPRMWFLVNTRETSGDRVRLSLAHELGHAVLHRYLPVHDESRLEPEAYEFAAALTLPASEFNGVIDESLTLSRARDLKRAYRISIQAIIRAAHERGLISKPRYTSLYKQISARGWRRMEPDPIPVEPPSTWPAALDIHKTRHGYGVDDLAAIARLSADDLRNLFPTDLPPSLRLVQTARPRGVPHLEPGCSGA
jgi:Zn-dependent peptidase ImmA (M78 family)/transcriptional regulator with XRE-family HTH domain